MEMDVVSFFSIRSHGLKGNAPVHTGTTACVCCMLYPSHDKSAYRNMGIAEFPATANLLSTDGPESRDATIEGKSCSFVHRNKK
jgi:hypothetical protein